MRGGSDTKRGERGQALILGALALVVLFGFTAMAVDVGFFIRHRAVVQQAVDAAALAGAQALPDDKVMAEQLAKDFAEKNGVDPATVQVTFRCTSEFQLACDPAADRWDTIQVSGEMDVPFFFAPVLKVSGATTNCWLGACPVVNSAAGCRGLCGSSPFTAVDVMMILDHTASMTSGDLDNAKAGTLALYEYFDADIQRVGLIPTPPVDPINYCDSINLWTDPKVWLSVPLTFNYQTSPHVLDYSSPLVNNTQCLDRPSSGELPGVHTNLGEPVKQAVDEFQANGRPDVKYGLILLTDGAANIWDPAPYLSTTGFLSPSANAAVTSSAGDNNGYQTSPTNAYADGGGNAADDNSGTGTSTSCGSTGKDRHRYYNYGVSLPAGATVTGIEARLDAWADSSFGTSRLCVEMSWNGGSSWTSAKTTADLTSSETSYYAGGATDLWGRASWSAADLSDANFRVRITDVSDSTSRDFRLDWAPIRVYYTTPGQNLALGPCDFAAQQADAAKALDIDVFTIAYGADDSCTHEDAGSPWAGATAQELLQYMATDEWHFFSEPLTSDLAPIFQVIGAQLATGSRLVPTQ